MAEQPIQIEVTFDGASEATRELGRVSQGISNVGQTADRAGVTVESFSRGFQNTAQRIQGVAGAVQSLASALGSGDRTAGLVASVAGATAQFAAMGAMLGPAGAIVGGVIGLTTSLISLSSAHEDAAEAANRESDALSSLEANATTARTALVRLNEARRRASEIGEEEAAAETLDRFRRGDIRAGEGEVAVQYLEDRFRAAVAEGAVGALADPEFVASWNSGLEELVSRAREVAESDRLAASRPRGGGGGGGRRERERDVFEMLGGAASNRDIFEIGEEAGAHADRLAEERIERERETNDAILELAREHSAALREEELARASAMKEIEVDEMAKRREAMQRELEENNERMEEAKARHRAFREDVTGDITSAMGQTTMMMGKSIAAIATGEQTAEQAFEGMAKAFLEMISQYATLKAATEFAEAGAAFARYDYASGAAHIGVGVAFTAVAVATGVGAAAIGSAPSAPARPEAGGGTEAAQGGDVVINWNSPVITAGTQAELGRELQAAVSAAGSI